MRLVDFKGKTGKLSWMDIVSLVENLKGHPKWTKPWIRAWESKSSMAAAPLWSCGAWIDRLPEKCFGVFCIWLRKMENTSIDLKESLNCNSMNCAERWDSTASRNVPCLQMWILHRVVTVKLPRNALFWVLRYDYIYVPWNTDGAFNIGLAFFDAKRGPVPFREWFRARVG